MKSSSISRQLLADIIKAFVDALQVGPCPLDFHPNPQHRVSHSQLLLQLHHPEQEVIYMLALEDAMEMNLEEEDMET